jgi:SdpI/YfhL protein family
MAILLGFFVTSGLLLAALSIPLILGRIGPNSWYGFRIQQTLDDPAVWYPVNAYSARGLLAVGLAIVVAAIGLYFVPDIDLAVYASAVGAIALGGMAITFVLSLRYIKALARRRGEVGE